MIFFVKALLMSVLPFYRIDFVADPYPSEVTYLAYREGTPAQESVLDASEIDALRKLLENNKRGWRYDLTSYAPKYVFASSTMNVNCSDDGRLVVNYQKASTQWVQISRTNFVGSCPVIKARSA